MKFKNPLAIGTIVRIKGIPWRLMERYPHHCLFENSKGFKKDISNFDLWTIHGLGEPAFLYGEAKDDGYETN